MPLTREELGRLAQECVDIVTTSLGTGEFEEDAREAFRQLVADPVVRRNHPRVAHAIETLLSVDLQKPANRKGAVPAAMGLVRRRSKATVIRNLAIQFMLDRLQDYVEPENDDFDGDADPFPQTPYVSPFQAAKATVAGFDEAGIDSNLDESYVLKIADNPFR